MNLSNLKIISDFDLWKRLQDSMPPELFIYRDELKRRGHLAVMKRLGWNVSFDAKYRNRYTASIKTLYDLWQDRVHGDHYESLYAWIKDQGWLIFEHWVPVDIWTSEACFSEYLPKNTLEYWCADRTKEVKE